MSINKRRDKPLCIYIVEYYLETQGNSFWFIQQRRWISQAKESENKEYILYDAVCVYTGVCTKCENLCIRCSCSPESIHYRRGTKQSCSQNNSDISILWQLTQQEHKWMEVNHEPQNMDFHLPRLLELLQPLNVHSASNRARCSIS